MSDPLQQIPTFDQVMQKDTQNGKIPSFADIMGEQPPVKKKEIWHDLVFGSNNGSSQSNASGLVSIGKTGANKTDVMDDIPGSAETQADRDRIAKNNPKVEIDPEDPVKSIFKPLKDRQKEIFDKNIRIESTGQNPITKKAASDEVNHINDVANIVRDNTFKKIEDAKEWLSKHPDTENNETSKLAAPIVISDKITSQAMKDHPYDIAEQAIQVARMRDDNIGEQLRVLKNGNEPVPKELEGQLVHDYITQNRTVKELAQKDKGFRNEIKNQSDLFYVHYPSLRQQMILSKIADMREKEGMNNPIINLPGARTSDKIITELVEKGDLSTDDRKFYAEVVRPKIQMGAADIPTPGFIENTVKSTAKGIEDITTGAYEVTGLRNLLHSKADILSQTLQEDLSKTTTPNYSGINRVTNATGNLAGVLLPVGLEARGLKALGAVKDIELANQLAMGNVFYHDIYSKEVKNNPDNPELAHLSAMLQSTIWAKGTKPLQGLTQDIVRSESPKINQVLKSLQSGEIDKATAARTITQNIVNKAVKVGGETISAANHVGATVAINDAVSGVISGKYDTDQSAQNVAHTYGAMLLGLPLLNMVKVAGANNVTADNVDEMASHPDYTRQKINELAAKDPEFAKMAPELLQNLDHLINVKEQLKGREDLTDDQKKKFQLTELQKVILENKIKNSPSKALTTPEQKQVASLEIEQKKITDPEMGNKKFVEEFYNEDLLPKGSKMLLEDEKGKFSEHKVGEYLKFIAQQANNLDQNWQPHEGKAPDMASIPAAIIETANERWHKEIDAGKPKIEEEKLPVAYKAEADNLAIPDQQKIEENEQPVIEENKGATEPIPTEAEQPTTAEPNQDSGAAEPPTQEVSDELPFGKGETTGIAHEVQEARTYDIKQPKPERGEGVTVEDAINHGKELLGSGEDPDKAAADFQKDKKISYDALSLVRAKHADLVKQTNETIDKYGDNSKEAQQAQKEETDWYNRVVKPMQTEWSKIGVAQQGEVDIDTGSFAGLRRSREQNTGKPLTDQQKTEAKELAGKVQKLTKENENLKNQLDELLANGGKQKGPKTSIKLQGKALADKIRTFKTKSDKAQANLAAIPVAIYDGTLELVATAIENGAKLVDAIQQGIDHLKASGYLKDKKDEDDFTSHIGEMAYGDLFTHFVGKTDNKFSPEEAKGIWDYLKNEYLDKGQSFSDAIHKTGVDLGLKPQQVIDVLATPKGAKQITNKMYRVNYERNKAIRTAKNWASKPEKTNPVTKLLDTIASPFRGLATLGHGHALLFTHAGMNMFDPRNAKTFFNLLGRQFKLVYGNQKYFDQAEASLTNHPLYDTALRSGLAVDPHSVYDDWQLANSFLKRLKIQGNKGFLVLKLMRIKIFESEVSKLSNIEKQDPETLKEIATIANHWTGTAGIKPSPVANAFVFAPNLIVSKFARITTDPIKAIATLANWKNASMADRAAAKIIIKKSARIATMYLAALGANQGLLSLTGSNQKINFLNPFQSDWLKFKAGNKTVDPSSGMQSTLGFLIQLGALPFEGKKDIKKDYYGAASAKDATVNLTSGFLRKITSPFGGTVWDALSHKDFEGNTLPFYNDKPQSGRKKLTYFDYFMEKAPIPISEGYRDFGKEMEQDGTPKPLVQRLLNSIIIASAGSGGLKISNEPKERPTPFTDEDKKDPTFKYFLDKGMELPNTSLQSEKIKDEKTSTIKNVSDYPKETQDRYSQAHKEYLKEELQDIKDEGVVYVNQFGEVSVTRPSKGDYDEKDIDKLTKTQLAEVLHIAQAQATKKAKNKVFYNE